MAIAATNRFNVEATRGATLFDDSAPDAPTTQTISSFGIRVGGVYIGRITGWTPSPMDRSLSAVKELNPTTYGARVDIVPGGNNTYSLSFNRAEVWNEEVEKAFGEVNVYNLLTDQKRPFVVDEVFVRSTGVYRVNRHLGVWWENLARGEYNADGDNIITVSGTMQFVNKIRIV